VVLATPVIRVMLVMKVAEAEAEAVRPFGMYVAASTEDVRVAQVVLVEAPLLQELRVVRLTPIALLTPEALVTQELRVRQETLGARVILLQVWGKHSPAVRLEMGEPQVMEAQEVMAAVEVFYVLVIVIPPATTHFLRQYPVLGALEVLQGAAQVEDMSL
jgi:hypothetical protein